MKVVSLNLNGIRASARKGVFAWLASLSPDVICVQETKAQMVHLPMEDFTLPGYHAYFHDAEKKGYSGVGIYTRREPDQITRGLGFPVADTEGRYIQADFGLLSVCSLYMPSGSSKAERQLVKFDFISAYQETLARQQASGRDVIICGDWNIVHREIDIKNFKSNQKNSGCLPEERQWLDDLLQAGWLDAFRLCNQSPGEYTWWSNRGNAYANNVGWRIDYQIISESMGEAVQEAFIYKEERFSDHAPLIVAYHYPAWDSA
jgi:exodeoxyribonuclease-3